MLNLMLSVTVRAMYTLTFPTTKFGFTGVGYNPNDGNLISLTENNIDGHRIHSDHEAIPALSALLYTACLCNNATLVQSGLDSSMAEGHTGGALSGQPTELALLVAAEKAGLADPRPQYHRLQEVPFTSERKRMEVRARPVSGQHACDYFQQHPQLPLGTTATAAPPPDGSLYFVKGMPEKVLGECYGYIATGGASAYGSPGSSSPPLLQPLDEEAMALALGQSRRMAASGLRVIALAYGPDLSRLTFAGLVGMEDPPREGVAESVRQLRQGGVKCFMITGDAKETALAVAKRCGILGSDDGMDEVATVPSGLEDLLSLSANNNHCNGAMIRAPLSGENSLASGTSDIEFGSSEAMSGAEIDEISEKHLADSIAGVKVFYRVSPRHKLMIVRACKFSSPGCTR
jgi:P-type Ca2+ transporter type 2C